jgi:hypothetical protein
MVTKRSSYSQLLPHRDANDPLANGYSGTLEDDNDNDAHLPKLREDLEDPNENDLDVELQEIELEMHDSKSHGSTSSYHDSLLFMTHANSITFSIGLTTLLLFWIPLPFLHWFGLEEFGLPRSLSEFAAVIGVCFGGVIFNAGFMILLAHWGPVVTSVGNLFTLILVAGSDEVIAILNGYNALSLSTLVGSGFILASFGILMTAPNAEEDGQDTTKVNGHAGHARSQSLPHAMP